MKQFIFFLLFLTLTACGASALGEAAAPPPTETTAAAQPAPTATVRLVMIATDPTTFERSAGRPQLVEFFAFW